jgi:hypothetical protein
LTSYASGFFTLLPLDFEITFISEPVRLTSSVSPENVASCVRLKIPWINQKDITFSDTPSPFQLAANPAQPLLAVLIYHLILSAPSILTANPRNRFHSATTLSFPLFVIFLLPIFQH